MKTSHWAAVPAAVLSFCAVASTRVLAADPITTYTIPSAPRGELSAYPSVVQTGTKPTLTWDILYPASFGLGGGGSGGGNDGSEPLVEVNPPGTLTPSQPLYVTVQNVGNGVTACSTTQDPLPHYVDIRVSLSRGSYKQIFYGTAADVDPSKRLYIKKLSAGQTVDFGASYFINGASTPFYTTWSRNMQVIALVNGATIPTSLPLYQSSNLKSYLKPYLNSTGTVNVGPLSALILMELGQVNRNSPCFDLQDVVLLVTFSTSHPNNGHGNNLDGVDVSNPGAGQGGPNGMVDLSKGVDDEIR
ncbi:MAG: hypothetical protein V4819_22490 [Verrucomicrobiota bacterium]